MCYFSTLKSVLALPANRHEEALTSGGVASTGTKLEWFTVQSSQLCSLRCPPLQSELKLNLKWEECKSIIKCLLWMTWQRNNYHNNYHKLHTTSWLKMRNAYLIFRNTSAFLRVSVASFGFSFQSIRPSQTCSNLGCLWANFSMSFRVSFVPFGVGLNTWYRTTFWAGENTRFGWAKVKSRYFFRT